MDSIVGVVMVATIVFADGTPPEQTYVAMPSIEQCMRSATFAIVKAPAPVRKHPIQAYSIMCAVGTDLPAGLPRRK